jgi:predicted metal-dependent HD superfamily phosphohydrolase
MDLAARFARSWRQTGATTPGAEVWAVIAAGYSEPHRHYHTLVHLEHCLRELEVVEDRSERLLELELAIFFHDLVYDPERTDNEEVSAQRARDLLLESAVSSEIVERVAELILSTKAHSVALTGDAALLSDIDLAILGSQPERYREYEAEVRREYQFVPEELFWTHRGRFARSFLDRKRIFHSPELFERYEEQARINLETSANAG